MCEPGPSTLQPDLFGMLNMLNMLMLVPCFLMLPLIILPSLCHMSHAPMQLLFP